MQRGAHRRVAGVRARGSGRNTAEHAGALRGGERYGVLRGVYGVCTGCLRAFGEMGGAPSESSAADSASASKRVYWKGASCRVLMQPLKGGHSTVSRGMASAISVASYSGTACNDKKKKKNQCRCLGVGWLCGYRQELVTAWAAHNPRYPSSASEPRLSWNWPSGGPFFFFAQCASSIS